MGKKYKGLNIFTLLLFPLILVITNFLRISKTFWSCRVLLNKDWKNYNRFRPHNGVNSLFYLTHAVNFKRYGRNGSSPYVGTGNYKISNWWHLSGVSLFLTRKIGVMFPVFCMIGFLLSHLIWVNYTNVEVKFLCFALILAVLSSYFYGGSFVFLNYNVFGWLFMPLGLFGLITENYIVAGLAWFLVSQGSLTVFFFATCLTFSWAILTSTTLPFLALVPGILKFACHFLYLDNPILGIVKIIKAIGLDNSVKSTVKYKRPRSEGLLTLYSVYFMVTWSTFSGILLFYDQTRLFFLVFTVIILWIINNSLARFADRQSFYIAQFAIGTVCLVLAPKPLLFAAYWLGVSPPAGLLGTAYSRDSFLSPKSLKPFEIGGLIDRARSFLDVLPEDSRVLLASEDPEGQYNKIFDGYRVINELLFYVGNLKKLLIFPDWWAVFDNNTTDAPEFWGTSPKQVCSNLRNWNGSHVIIYQPTGTKLNKEWIDAGFSELASMDWSEIYEDDLNQESCWGNQPVPKWFLLKPPQTQAVA